MPNHFMEDLKEISSFTTNLHPAIFNPYSQRRILLYKTQHSNYLFIESYGHSGPNCR